MVATMIVVAIIVVTMMVVVKHSDTGYAHGITWMITWPDIRSVGADLGVLSYSSKY
jgi:hypothetical protein